MRERRMHSEKQPEKGKKDKGTLSGQKGKKKNKSSAPQHPCKRGPPNDTRARNICAEP